jgi:predicted regulator of amino acid metabolism with ACT domain
MKIREHVEELNSVTSRDMERRHRRIARLLGVNTRDVQEVITLLAKPYEQFRVDVRDMVREALAKEREGRVRASMERAAIRQRRGFNREGD